LKGYVPDTGIIDFLIHLLRLETGFRIWG